MSLPSAAAVRAKTLLAAELIRPVASIFLVLVGYSRLVRFITRSILLPSSVIGKNLQHLDLCAKNSKVKVERKFTVKRTLDCCILAADDRKTTKGWLVYSNANGVCYEHVLPYTKWLGKFLNKRVCVFNYRGVGHSRGTCHNAQDMVEDLINIVHALPESDSDNDVILWGHSIGGAVSLLAAQALASSSKQLKIKVLADRSFYDLTSVVRDKINQGPMAPVVSGLLATSLLWAVTLASVLSFGVHPWPSFSSDEHQVIDFARSVLSGLSLGWVALRLGAQRVHVPVLFGFFSQLFVGNVLLRNLFLLDSLPVISFLTFSIAFEMGFHGKMNPILEALVAMQGWTMNPGRVAKKFLKEKRLVLTFHAEDEMIAVEYSLKKSAVAEENECVVELDGPQFVPGQQNSNHMYELNLHELERIKELLEVQVDYDEDEDEVEKDKNE